LIPPVGDPSFPSGHTSASFAAATAIYAINKKWGITAYIFAAVMGFSRLYLGVHFPTDVLAGALVGTAAAMIVIKIFDAKQRESV
ncbi:MAG: phosphatase PAP2 family protein, partial [Anaerotignum sp.]|nr:phosphatase PAP2 family protein [Anaerotignum sp.]